MSLNLYPSIIHKGDLSPDAVGDDINDTVEVSPPLSNTTPTNHHSDISYGLVSSVDSSYRSFSLASHIFSFCREFIKLARDLEQMNSDSSKN